MPEERRLEIYFRAKARRHESLPAPPVSVRWLRQQRSPSRVKKTSRFPQKARERFARTDAHRDAGIARIFSFEVALPLRFRRGQDPGVIHIESVSESWNKAAAIDEIIGEGAALRRGLHGES